MRRIYSLLLFCSFWLIFLLTKLFLFLLSTCRLNRMFRKGKTASGAVKMLVLESQPSSEAGSFGRVHNWIPYLNQEHIEITVKTALNEADYRTYITPNTPKSLLAIRLLFNRFAQCISAMHYDVVVVRRELLLFFDYGGTFMEQFLLAISPSVILDFDDDLGTSKRKRTTDISLFGKLMLESKYKFDDSLLLYRHFTTSGIFLLPMVSHEQNSNIFDLPNCVKAFRPSQFDGLNNESTKTIVWMGGAGKLKHLETLAFDTFERLHASGANFELIILTKPGSLKKQPKFPFKDIAWSNEVESEWMSKAHFGLAPYDESAFDTLAGSYKTIQYLSYGCIPLVTDYEVLKNHFIDKKEGFFVPNDQWPIYLERILKMDWQEASQMSENAYRAAAERYSYESKLPEYATFIKKVAQKSF